MVQQFDPRLQEHLVLGSISFNLWDPTGGVPPAVHIPRINGIVQFGGSSSHRSSVCLKIGCYKHQPALSSKFPCSENGRTWRLPVFTARKPLEFTEQRPEFRCADFIASSSSGVSCRETPPWFGQNVAA